MWVPKALVELFSIGKETVDTLRTELVATQAINISLDRELTALKVNFDWLRLQVNALQVERTALMQKAYGVQMPIPEIVRTIKADNSGFDAKNFSFDDIGEDQAKALGLPTYAKQ